MSNLLNQVAVGRKGGEDAKELLGAYLGTAPAMALNHTAEAAPQTPAPAVSAPGPGGSTSSNRAAAQAVVAGVNTPAIGKGPEYEVFRNEKDALAFFMYRQGTLDAMGNDGPFWFQVEGNRIIAGSEQHQTLFEGMSDELIAIAMKRGVIMLVEFENQLPVRCTPCYLTDTI